MPATRISARGHERLQRLSEETGESHQEIIDRALDIYERERLLDALNADFATLRANPDAWSEELAERAAWDATSNDFGADS